MEDPLSPYLLSQRNLDKRDRMAIDYSRSGLTEGDTLIIVRYPADDPVYDATGFVLDTTFRVNSSKLFATGSSVFIKMLSQENQQKYRQKPEFKCLYIPKDVAYVLDLTPSKDDDDALELVTSLSCPKGILCWSMLASRIPIPQKYVSGEDERAGGRKEPSQQPPNLSLAAHINTNIEIEPLDNYGSELKQATENSLKDSGVEDPGNLTIAAETPTWELAADYCGIRHCAGIERLLKLIEGKEARLDSAPKIWTVAMLANFFDCTSAVVDVVCTWVMSQKNGIIIEILPESCLRLGLALRCELITRAAFAVLVSEEALSIGGQEGVIPFKPAPTTEFGRVREDLDDDTINMVQHAGRSFFEKIDAQVKNFLHQDMTWFTSIPEYHKLEKFGLRLGLEDPEQLGTRDSALRSMADLQEGLRHYIRGRLFYCSLQHLNQAQIEIAGRNRNLERYISSVPVDIKDRYDNFIFQQRVLTRQFWEIVRGCGWGVAYSNSNLLYQKLDSNNPLSITHANLSIASLFQIKNTHMIDLFHCRDVFNLALFDYETRDTHLPDLDPKLTLASLSEPVAWASTRIDKRNARIFNFAEKYEYDLKFGRNSPFHCYMAWAYRLVKTGSRADPKSEFFDIYQFMEEVCSYITHFCDAMLDRGEHRSFSLPETLTCLTDDEYKYLPLFAGGFEDGTGGVYQDELPPAEAGPSGPGPSYHTGFSIVSAASSTTDWEEISAGAQSESTIDGWSRDVDDGKTDHIDRRRVGSEVSFGSHIFEDLGVGGKGKVMNLSGAVEYTGNGKGKETENHHPSSLSQPKSISEGESSTTSQPSSMDSLMSHNFFVEGEEEDFDSSGEDDDFDFMDDSGDDTATEKGDNDDNDQM